MSLESFLYNFGAFTARSMVYLFSRSAGKMNEVSTRSRPVPQTQTTDDNRRLAGCRQVVMEYLDLFGYIARECITREELERLIDNGIEPQDLAAEIQSRIDAKPGIMLGSFHLGSGAVPVKLPNSLRDRHMYIIGRSGSGKTNLIRLMAMQDIAFGHGVGMLAPEQELLTEEILPYIPEDRIDD